MALSRQNRLSNSLLIALSVHLILITLFALTITTKYKEKEFITLDWVKLPRTARTVMKPKIKRVEPTVRPPTSLNLVRHRVNPNAKPLEVRAAASQSFSLVRDSANISVNTPEAKMGDIKTETKIPVKPHEITLPTRQGMAGESERGALSSRAGTAIGRGKTITSKGMGAALVESTGTTDSASLAGSDFSGRESVPDNQLGAVITGEGYDISGHIRLIRLKHSLSDWWQDPTAMPSLFKWLAENTRIRADMKFKGGSLRMTDPDILDAPLIFMTGHDKDITVGRGLAKDGPLSEGFTAEERAALRKYIIDRGGMLFFDDCGFNGLFAQQVALEFDKIFPEYPLKDIPHNHEIYKLFYELPIPPRGGDVFWSAPGAAQGAGGVYRPISSRFAYQKGISIGSRLAIVYNRKDYLCSMETAEVDSRARLRDRRSPDVHRFMTNLFVYAMKYGGNTDRSNYMR